MRAIFLRDIKLALRAGGGFGLSLGFFLILVSFVPFAIGNDLRILGSIAGGILWIGALLACLLSLDRIFHLDAEDGALDALLTAPLPKESLVFAKSSAHWICTGLPLSFASLPLGYALHLPPAGYSALFFGLLIGTPALSFIGSFAAALTLGVKRGGLLLSIIVLPLYIPSLVFGAVCIRASLDGLDFTAPIVFLASISMVSAATLPFISAICLRIYDD